MGWQYIPIFPTLRNILLLLVQNCQTNSILQTKYERTHSACGSHNGWLTILISMTDTDKIILNRYFVFHGGNPSQNILLPVIKYLSLYLLLQKKTLKNLLLKKNTSYKSSKNSTNKGNVKGSVNIFGRINRLKLLLNIINGI